MRTLSSTEIYAVSIQIGPNIMNCLLYKCEQAFCTQEFKTRVSAGNDEEETWLLSYLPSTISLLKLPLRPHLRSQRRSVRHSSAQAKVTCTYFEDTCCLVTQVTTPGIGIMLIHNVREYMLSYACGNLIFSHEAVDAFALGTSEDCSHDQNVD